MSERVARFCEVATLALLAATLTGQLLVQPAIGLANNGDFPRIMSHFDIGYRSDNYDDNFFGFATQKFRVDPSLHWESGFISSESILVALALPLNRLLFHDGWFDIRSLGVIHIALLLVGAWLLIVWSRELRSLPRAVFLILLLVIFTDIGYTSFLNSFYSEPASFVFLEISLGLLLLAAQRQSVRLLYVLLAAALMFVFAKPQNSLLGIAMALLILLMITLRQDAPWKRACAITAAVLCAASLLYQAIQPRWLRNESYWTAIVTELLRDSLDPVEDLAQLDITCELSPFAGRNAFDTRVPQSKFAHSFFDRISFGKIGVFYARHPVRLYALLKRLAPYSLLVRPGTGPWENPIGNYDRSAGHPAHALATSFTFWGGGKRWISSESGILLTCFFAINILAAMFVFTNSPSAYGRFLVATLVVLITMAMSQALIVVMTAGGFELIKHLFLFNLLLDSCVVFDLVWLAAQVPALAFKEAEKIPTRRSAPKQAGTAPRTG